MRTGRHRSASRALLVAAILLFAGAAHADQLSDDLAKCNSKEGQAAMQRCLDAAVARDGERVNQRREQQRIDAQKSKDRAAAQSAARKKALDAAAPQQVALAREYGAFVRALFPDYNYIEVSATHAGATIGLRAVHPLFSSLTFAAGPAGPQIEAWITKHAGRLRAALISSVGVTSPAGSESAFQVPK